MKHKWWCWLVPSGPVTTSGLMRLHQPAFLAAGLAIHKGIRLPGDFMASIRALPIIPPCKCRASQRFVEQAATRLADEIHAYIEMGQ
jgi:hypothetical protein